MDGGIDPRRTAGLGCGARGRAVRGDIDVTEMAVAESEKQCADCRGEKGGGDGRPAVVVVHTAARSRFIKFPCPVSCI